MTTVIECHPAVVDKRSQLWTSMPSRPSNRQTWSSGDYAVIGTTLQIVGERLAEAMDLRAGQTVLDVAAGNGNATLAAARRWCEVTSTDYVESSARAAAASAPKRKGFKVKFQVADAEDLPFADASFDAVVSTFGGMFSPDQDRTCRRNGARVQVPRHASVSPTGRPKVSSARCSRRSAKYLPPPTGVKSPAVWGTLRAGLKATFGPAASTDRGGVSATFTFRYRSAQHFLDIFRAYYGPVLKAFEALDEAGRQSASLATSSIWSDASIRPVTRRWSFPANTSRLSSRSDEVLDRRCAKSHCSLVSKTRKLLGFKRNTVVMSTAGLTDLLDISGSTQMVERPVIMVIDDEPDALAAMLDALTRRFGGDYRVVPHLSGHAALAGVSKIQEAKQEIALIIADQRMPEMTGREFLARVRSIVPTAKRALMVDWGDHEVSSTVLQACALGELDNYLYKPWTSRRGAPVSAD